MSDRTRREALQTAALTLPILPVLNAQTPHAHSSANEEKPKADTKPRTFSPQQLRTLQALVDLLIPRTDTPGASDAGVHISIDRRAGDNPQLKQEIVAGLHWSNEAASGSFVEAPEGRQVAILSEAADNPSHAGAKFFRTVKNLTVDTYYNTKEGLTQELGWNANTYVAEWTGCTHKEHGA